MNCGTPGSLFRSSQDLDDVPPTMCCLLSYFASQPALYPGRSEPKRQENKSKTKKHGKIWLYPCTASRVVCLVMY